MDLFLLHSVILVWASIGAARRLVARLADGLLAAALLAWGNIVVTSLSLSVLHRLGEPLWFFGTSTLLALLTALLLQRTQPATPDLDALPEGPGASVWLVGAFVVTIAPLALINLAVAWAYAPSGHEAVTYQLPRALFYLGQGSLGHFDASDTRLILQPFNYSLLQAFGLVYGPALQVLNIFNLAAWAISGIALYRLCRLCAIGANAALVTCWLGLTATPVLAQATATTHELPAAAAALGALVFALRWAKTNLAPEARLAGLAAGLAAASSVTVLCVVPLLVLLALVFAVRSWRRGDLTRWTGPARAWMGPTLIALAAAAPFALINLVGKGRWAADLILNRSPDGTISPGWAGFLPLSGKPILLTALNEDVAGFGFTGVLVLLGGIVCLLRSRRLAGPVRWFAWVGFAWLLVKLCVAGGSYFFARDFVPVFLLFCPCVGVVLAAGLSARRSLRFAGYGIVVLAALEAGWSAGIYSMYNTSRPLRPLLNAASQRPAFPSIPLSMQLRLTNQRRINIATDGIGERIFPFMTQGPGQRFTAHRGLEPGAYNLLSRSSLSRDATYENGARLPSYTFIPIPKKQTAGVESLTTLGSGASARDYFEVVPQAGQAAPTEANRHVLVTLYHVRPERASKANTLITVVGLNPNDHAQLAVNVERADRSAARVATFARDGETLVALDGPFRQLAFRVLDNTSGAELGATAISRVPGSNETIRQPAPDSRTTDRSIFALDLVLAKATRGITVEGLLPVEGPFPQWDLPLLRWARQPVTRITFPPIDGLSRLQLSFSTRLHVRTKGAFDVLLNGEFIKRYHLDGPGTWLDETLELTPQAGKNVVEFKDAPLNHQPAWLDYLERYPDVMNHLVTNHVPLEQGAREHYENYGRGERRTMQTDEMPAVPEGSYYFMYRNLRLEGFSSP